MIQTLSHKHLWAGFTLTELLIALAILGVIATFTIPKVLVAQQNSQFNAIGKETAGSISAAFQQLKLEKTISASTSFGDFTSYLNYVRVDTVTQLDGPYNDIVGNICGGGGWLCLKLHNGGMLKYHPGQTFSGTASTNAIYFYLDPDGKLTDNSTNGPGKALGFFIYADGAIRTGATIKPGTTTSWGPETNWSDAPWFSWN